MILLKNPMNASTKLSMNGRSPMISIDPAFVLRLSKDERRVFQHNYYITPAEEGPTISATGTGMGRTLRALVRLPAC